jgi:hypothetical protein
LARDRRDARHKTGPSTILAIAQVSARRCHLRLLQCGPERDMKDALIGHAAPRPVLDIRWPARSGRRPSPPLGRVPIARRRHEASRACRPSSWMVRQPDERLLRSIPTSKAPIRPWPSWSAACQTRGPRRRRSRPQSRPRRPRPRRCLQSTPRPWAGGLTQSSRRSRRCRPSR